MDIKEGTTISGIDIDGREVEGIVVNTMDTFKFAIIQIGNDRLDRTVIHYDNIK